MRVLDTTVAIDHLRGHAAAVDLLTLLLTDGVDLAASEIVRFELLAGVREPEIKALEEFFGAITWITVDEAVTRTAGELARTHRASFSGIDAADYLIAATSIVLGAPLLTTNVRHFPMFKGLEPAYE